MNSLRGKKRFSGRFSGITHFLCGSVTEILNEYSVESSELNSSSDDLFQPRQRQRRLLASCRAAMPLLATESRVVVRCWDSSGLGGANHKC